MDRLCLEEAKLKGFWKKDVETDSEDRAAGAQLGSDKTY